MTYGVDECRYCGAAIKQRGPKAMEDYQNSRGKKSPMPEAEWRALGMMAPPTQMQIWFPTNGCCDSCALRVATKRARPIKPLIALGIWALIVACIIGYTATLIH
jgi:hypothetical protein